MSVGGGVTTSSRKRKTCEVAGRRMMLAVGSVKAQGQSDFDVAHEAKRRKIHRYAAASRKPQKKEEVSRGKHEPIKTLYDPRWNITCGLGLKKVELSWKRPRGQREGKRERWNSLCCP